MNAVTGERKRGRDTSPKTQNYNRIIQLVTLAAGSLAMEIR